MMEARGGGGFGGRHKSHLEPYGESGKYYRDKRQNPSFLHKRLQIMTSPLLLYVH